MIHRLFTRTPPPAPFPERLDLPFLTDREAYAALGLLKLLVEAGAADVYRRPFTPEGERPRWNVWLNEQIKPGGEQIELQDWAARTLCVHYRPDEGDAA
jgi:hypothetical protein